MPNKSPETVVGWSGSLLISTKEIRQNNLFVPHKMPEWPPPLYNCVLLLLGVFSL